MFLWFPHLVFISEGWVQPLRLRVSFKCQPVSSITVPSCCRCYYMQNKPLFSAIIASLQVTISKQDSAPPKRGPPQYQSRGNSLEWQFSSFSFFFNMHKFSAIKKRGFGWLKPVMTHNLEHRRALHFKWPNNITSAFIYFYLSAVTWA